MMVCRLSYVVWMLEELIHKIPSSADVCIMYDIACTLVQHLKGKRAAHLLERFQFALPAFHAYGHNAACQVCIEDFTTDYVITLAHNIGHIQPH